MKCIISLKFSTFLLIIDFFILISYSSQLDSNPCKHFETLQKVIPSWSFLDVIIKTGKMEANCKNVNENENLYKCLLIYLPNYDKERMAKLSKRFLISDYWNWNENKIVRNDSKEMLARKVDLRLNDGPFFYDFFGPIKLELECNTSFPLNNCILNEFTRNFGININDYKIHCECELNNKERKCDIRIEPIRIDKCPDCPPCLAGKWWLNKTTPNSMEEVAKKYPNVKKGSWKPPETECIARRRIAIVIPHRNRFAHLKALLNILHSFLQRQQADYRIFVADQAYPKDGTIDKFNKAKLLNAAYKVIREIEGYDDKDCYIFHDVDLVPEYDTNIYRCGPGPIRLFAAGDEWDYLERQDQDIVGGICAQTGDQFNKANGFSNIYWGWGNEDEDMRFRYKESIQTVEFVQRPIGDYASLELINKPDDPTNAKIKEECQKKLREWRVNNWWKDGLNNLKYDRIKIEYKQLYTNISIDVLMAESMGNHPCDKDFNEKGKFKKTFYKYKKL